jgi:riboflavin synthase
MFTGLIETIGTIRSMTRGEGAVRIGIESDLPASEMDGGESVAVDGACLTVTSVRDRVFYADAIPETLSRTTLGKLGVGSPVNLERALRIGGRLGGHLVQGHVDATADVREVHQRGDDYRIRIALVPGIRRYVAEKGSVALQGVSLTVSAVRAAEFEVAVIPETLARTTLRRLRRGDAVNVEVDLLARYLERLALPSYGEGGPPRKGTGIFPTDRGRTGSR